MSWEDVLKRGRVPPKKPTKKEKPDTSWQNRLPEKERMEFLPEPENIVERIKQESASEAWLKEYMEREEERKKRKPRPAPKPKERDTWQEIMDAQAKREKIAREKREGTHRPKKGQQRNQGQRAETPKMTRSQRKAANEAKARKEANLEAQRREDAARAARDRRRGL